MNKTLVLLEQLLRIRKLNYELEEKCSQEAKVKLWYAQGAPFDLENELYTHIENVIEKYIKLREDANEKKDNK